ncbi:hypothetical protein D3C76_1240300 [compost metagenome]
MTGVVKHGGKWYGPGDDIRGISEDEGNRIIKISAGELLPKTREEIAAEEDAAKASEAAEKAKKEEEEREAAAKKEREEAEKQLKALRKKATELGIKDASKMDAETLAAEIAAAEQK